MIKRITEVAPPNVLKVDIDMLAKAHINDVCDLFDIVVRKIQVKRTSNERISNKT